MVRLLESEVQTREVLDYQGVHLFHFLGSSCSQKLRIFLRLKGIDWNSHHVDLRRGENNSPHFLGINPRGVVPVLVHDGEVHIESNDIMEYLEDIFPDPPLIPRNRSVGLTMALQREDALHMDLRTLTVRFLMPPQMARRPQEILDMVEREGSQTIGGIRDERKAEHVRFWRDTSEQGITDEQVRTSAERFREALAALESDLAHKPWLFGDQLTLLDIAWFIYTHRLRTVGYRLARHPRLSAWYKRLRRRAEFSAETRLPLPLRLALSAMRWKQKIERQTLENIAFPRALKS